MTGIGKCGICGGVGKILQEHHIVEAPLEKYTDDRPPSTYICEECHIQHERYRNYLRDMCEIEIDTKKASTGINK